MSLLRRVLVSGMERYRLAHPVLRTGRRLTAWNRDRRYRALYHKYQASTVVAQHSFVDNLRLTYLYRGVRGVVVECGVWRAGMAAAIAEVLGPDRDYYLLDSYEGLPEPEEPLDGAYSVHVYRGWTASRAPLEIARDTMAQSGARKVEYIKGWFKDTVPGLKLTEPIAILRLDGDWYDSTMQCLEGFYDQVTSGGLIIIDDYHFWEGCTRATHDFLSNRKLVARIRETPSGVAYIAKDADRRP